MLALTNDAIHVFAVQVIAIFTQETHLFSFGGTAGICNRKRKALWDPKRPIKLNVSLSEHPQKYVMLVIYWDLERIYCMK